MTDFVLAYRLGAKLRDLDTFQYHPSGLAYPLHLAGTLITEGIRSAGGYLLNAQSERFIDELKPRDHVAAAIIRECREGRGIDAGDGTCGVWLDTPGLELRNPGMIEAKFPKLLHLGTKCGIDPRTQPMLIHPTLHYQKWRGRHQQRRCQHSPGAVLRRRSLWWRTRPQPTDGEFSAGYHQLRTQGWDSSSEARAYLCAEPDESIH